MFRKRFSKDRPKKSSMFGNMKDFYSSGKQGY